MAFEHSGSAAGVAVEMEPLSFPTHSQARRRLGEVASSRPSVRLGRQLSVKAKRPAQGVRVTSGAVDGEGGAAAAPSDQTFRREDATYRSLPAERRRVKIEQESGSPVRLRRASSLDNNRYEQWEELRVTFTHHRASSRRLQDRIARHRQTIARRPQYTRRNMWQHFINVKWPKIKSRLRVVFGYQLWEHHMKEVEGHFGTAVVSYFVFLRWLLLLNLIIFMLWFGLAVIPQLIWVGRTDAPRTPSQLSCVFEPTLPARSCPGLESPNNLDCRSLSDEDSRRHGQHLFCSGGEVDGEDVGRFDVSECQFDNENGSLVARREDPNRVVPGLISCLNISNFTGAECYYLCPSDIDPVVQWYEYIFDFALGRGIFNDTVLFQGRYTNETIEIVGGSKYNLPLAYILLTALIFILSVTLIVYKMGQAYSESNLELRGRRNINYCNKLFSSWDFSVTDANTAKLKRAQIKREFEEDIAELQMRSAKRDVKEWVKVILARTLANLLVVVILIGAGVAVFMAAQLGLDSQLEGDSLQLEGFVLPVVFTTFNITLPILFSFFARFERFSTQSSEIRMTLIRAIVVRLSSLVVLFVTLLILISCTQSFDNGGSDDMTEEDEGTCQFSVPDIIQADNQTSQITARENCPQCWETFVGQELYKLGLINFILSAITTLSVETIRNLVSRLPVKMLQEKIGKGDFNIAKSILDLIYTQALLWLGFFYSPFLPFVILVTSFMLFYVKKYSLVWNLVPSKRGAFKATRTNFLFLFLLLAVLLASFVPLGYTLARLHPSETCGPFRGRELIYDVVAEITSCRVRQVFDYLQSTGFLVPVIILLLLVCYAQWVVLRARKRGFHLLKQQLLLEAADATFFDQQLKQAKGSGVGVVSDDGVGVVSGGKVGVVPLQQRISGLQDKTEEERVGEKRSSGQVAVSSRPVSTTTAI